MANAPASATANIAKLLKQLGFACTAAVGLCSMIGAGLSQKAAT